MFLKPQKYLFLSAILFAIFPLCFVYGQDIGNVFDPSIEISLSPENPGPNTQTTATLTTNSFDINAAYISWTLNNQVLDQGIGKRSVTFNTLSGGQTLRLRAIVEVVDTGKYVKQGIDITPVDMDVIWESQGYLPPFYEGKARPVLQSIIVFTAIPHLKSISPQNLIYTWSKSSSVLQAQSGYGKNTIIISQDFLSRPFNLEVTAQSVDGSVVIKKSVFINPETPVLVLYEEEPLLGLRLENGTSKTFDFEKDELWLRAVPYFTDTLDRNGGLVSAIWKMNGQIVKEGPLEERNVFKRPEGIDKGKVNISLSFENDNKLLQSLTESFSILIKPLANNPVF